MMFFCQCGKMLASRKGLTVHILESIVIENTKGVSSWIFVFMKDQHGQSLQLTPTLTIWQQRGIFSVLNVNGLLGTILR